MNDVSVILLFGEGWQRLTPSHIMNLICWNCRGLGVPRAVQELVNRYNPLVLFLSETKKKSSKMDWLRSRWDFENCFAVDSVGKGGGLALLWMNEVFVEILSYSNSHIDARIGNINMGNAWRFTGFYGSPVVRYQSNSWELLRQLHMSQSMPWLCAGTSMKSFVRMRS